MYKDGSKICIDKLFESATEEESGLEVDVFIRDTYDNRKKIAKGVKQLTFYNNVYIDDPEKLINIIDYPSIEDFNVRKIEEFDTFKVCDCGDIQNSLLMGNVLYPIENSYIKKWFRGINVVPFAIKCNIGDVDITPSRENLLYSSKTIATIEKICEEALEEFKKICKVTFGSDFKTIEEYYQFSNSSFITITIKEFDTKSIFLEIPSTELSYYNISDKLTIKGNPISKELFGYYRKFRGMTFPSNLILYEYNDGKFHVKGNSCSISKYIEKTNSGRVALVSEPLTSVVKSYWRENYDNWHSYYFFYEKYIKSSFKRMAKDFRRSYGIPLNNPTIKFIFKDFMDNYTNLSTYSIENVPQSYIDDIKAANKKKRTAAQQKARKCVIYKLAEGRRYDSIVYEDYEFEKLMKFKGTIFFAEKGNSYLEAFYGFYRRVYNIDNPHIICIEVAPSNLPIIRNFKNAIEFNTVFTEKNNYISKICTYRYLIEKWNIYDLYLYTNFDDEVISDVTSLIYKLKGYTQALIYSESEIFRELFTTLCTTYYNNNWLNYNIINRLESNLPYIKLNNLFAGWSTQELKTVVLAFHDYVTKNNLSNVERFNRIKNILKPILDEYTPNQELPHFNI